MHGATVKDSVIMDDVIISENAKVFNAIIDADAKIGSGSVIGKIDGKKEEITVISGRKSISENTVILS